MAREPLGPQLGARCPGWPGEQLPRTPTAPPSFQGPHGSVLPLIPRASLSLSRCPLALPQNPPLCNLSLTPLEAQEPGYPTARQVASASEVLVWARQQETECSGPHNLGVLGVSQACPHLQPLLSQMLQGETGPCCLLTHPGHLGGPALLLGPEAEPLPVLMATWSLPAWLQPTPAWASRSPDSDLPVNPQSRQVRTPPLGSSC